MVINIMRGRTFDKYETVAIIGSFRKHYAEICAAAGIFQDNGLKVLAPDISKPKDPNAEFIILESDTTDNPRDLEKAYLQKCLSAHAVYCFCKDGHTGASTMFELGFIAASKQEVYFSELPNEPLIQAMIKDPEQIGSPEEIANRIMENNELNKIAEARECAGHAFFDADEGPEYFEL